MKSNQRFSTRSLVLTGMFVAVLAVLSQLSVPLPSGVPVTMQTFAVALTAYVLGPWMSAAATVIYILLGAVGVPVFANLYSGVGVLVGMTGGFIWGFLFMVILTGLAIQQKNKIYLLILSAAGLFICHLLGILQFMVVMGMDFVSAALAVSIPYLVKDIVSVIAAYFVALAIRRALNAANLAYGME